MDEALKENKVVFDGRNLFEVNKMSNLGYQYFSIGRKSSEIN
jgi:hypothetical protein